MPFYLRLATAIHAFVDALTGPAFFPEDRDDEPMTSDQWAALMVLHAEALHGCDHTDSARRELGMVGPRGKAAV